MLNGQDAISATRGLLAVRRELGRHPEIRPTVVQRHGGIEVDWIHNDGDGVAVQLTAQRHVTHVWTGYHASWPLTRGNRGAVGGDAAALWIWLPLCVLFAAAFINWRRLFSLRNADVAALLGLSVSFAFFNHGLIAWSVPLVYPPLAYLIWRLATVRSSSPAVTEINFSNRVLAWAIAPLLVLRVVLGFTSTYRLDTTVSTLFGADRLAHWLPLYGMSPFPGGDAYWPIIYEAYIPFEAIWPYHGQSNPTATHVANTVFDLLTVVAIWMLGRRMAGQRGGVVLAYAWLTLPLGLLGLCTGTNDVVVAFLVTAALAMAARPVLSGVLTGFAALTKVAPALMVPLMATHPGISSSQLRRRAPLFLIGLALAGGLTMIPVIVHTPIATILDRALAGQASKYSPLSIWGLYDPDAHSSLAYALASLVRALAISAALVVAIRPRTRDLRRLSASTGMVLIAAQLGSMYWLYPYAIWFLPATLAALLGPSLNIAAAEPRRDLTS